jgi:N-acetyl-gamma-glutamyl-phosphate reductase
MRKRLTLIGERGVVSQMLQERIRQRDDILLSVVSTDSVLETGLQGEAPNADVFLLATTDFASAKVIEQLPRDARILDISPAFRLDSEWAYGLPELPGARERIRSATRVANPGCFATSAILLLEPLISAELLKPEFPLYLDATGGYTTGGSKLVQQAESSQLPVSATYGLARKHRHIEEIQRYGGVKSPVWFAPEIGHYAQGIRMQIPLHGLDRDEVLHLYASSYLDPLIVVHEEIPNRLEGNVWAGRQGAGIWVIPQEQGIIAISAIDNLEKGAVSSALRNTELMLNLDTV